MFRLIHVPAFKAAGTAQEEGRQGTAAGLFYAVDFIVLARGVRGVCRVENFGGVQVQRVGIVAGKVRAHFESVASVCLGKVSAELPDVRPLGTVSVGCAVRGGIGVADEPVDGDVGDQGNAADEIAHEIRREAQAGTGGA